MADGVVAAEDITTRFAVNYGQRALAGADTQSMNKIIAFTGLFIALLATGASAASAADQNPYGRDGTPAQPYRHVLQSTEKQVQTTTPVTFGRAR